MNQRQTEEAAGAGEVEEADVTRRRSPILFAWFTWYARRYLSKHFHAVRVSRQGRPKAPDADPIVILLNHPSWWDPMVGLALTALFPLRQHYAPIDAAALKGYGFFQRLGFFGVEQGTARGAAAFLRTSLRVLSAPGRALWVTGQGHFVDPRDRPVSLRPGVAHLARRLERGTILPLALEYPFWEERHPEALAFFGEPVDLARGPDGPETTEEWNRLLEGSLEATQDRLALEARARSPDAFEVVVAGRVGIGGVYDLWRRLKARLRGKRFSGAHGELLAPDSRKAGEREP